MKANPIQTHRCTFRNCWVLSDGKAGTETQCIGLAEALGLQPEIKRISLKFPWSVISPSVRICTDMALKKHSDDIGPPYPDLVIASGRASVQPGLYLKKQAGSRALRLIQVQDPRISPAQFDLVVTPEHDGLVGKNVISTLGALNRVTADKLAQAAQQHRGRFGHTSGPKIAVLIGGNSKKWRMTGEIADRLCRDLEQLCQNAGALLMVTASRRTPQEMADRIRDKVKALGGYYWDGQGDNPYLALLGLADLIVVTSDSVTMASEAAATGKPIYIYPLQGGAPKFTRFHEGLYTKGIAKPFVPHMPDWSYPPLNETERVAALIREKWL